LNPVRIAIHACATFCKFTLRIQTHEDKPSSAQASFPSLDIMAAGRPLLQDICTKLPYVFFNVIQIIRSTFAAPSEPAPPPFISSHQKLQYKRYQNRSGQTWAADHSYSSIPDDEVNLTDGSQSSVHFTGYIAINLFKPIKDPRNHKRCMILK
jgi:hypothetical protein